MGRGKNKKKKRLQKGTEPSTQTQTCTLTAALLHEDGTLEYLVTGARGWKAWVTDPEGKIRLPDIVAEQLRLNPEKEIEVSPVTVDIRGEPFLVPALSNAVVVDVVGKGASEK